MSVEPVEYRAIRNLQSALQGIAKADGYHYDVAATVVKLDPNQNVEALLDQEIARPTVFIEVNPDEWDYIEMPNGVLVRMPVSIYLIDDTDAKVDEDFVRAYFRACADMERAIAQDPTRGGYAADTRIRTRAYANRGARLWAKVDVAVDVRRVFGEPDV